MADGHHNKALSQHGHVVSFEHECRWALVATVHCSVSCLQWPRVYRTACGQAGGQQAVRKEDVLGH